MNQLQAEAYALCTTLSRVYWQELRSQNGRYVRPEELVRSERMRRIWRRAGDRWRRRMGYPELYRGER